MFIINIKYVIVWFINRLGPNLINNLDIADCAFLVRSRPICQILVFTEQINTFDTHNK
jgi:hypothetical protein